MEYDQYIKTIDDMEDLIVSSLGVEKALEEITKALTYDQKKDVYEWIIRCHDLEEDEV